MNLSCFFRTTRVAPDRQPPYRPVLEDLEDRCLLSGGFAQVNLASDVPGLARVMDPNVVNPWGVAFSPTGPFWFAENGRGVSDLLDGRGRPVPLLAAVPSAERSVSRPTGTVFNGGAGFAISKNYVSAPSRFLFATEDGTISGWSAIVNPFHALLAVNNSSSGAVYTGLALGTNVTGHSFLYAADFSHGTIDTFDQEFRPVVRPGAFHDPSIPDGFAPFNIQNINNVLYVTYGLQDEDGRDEVAGAGQGFIDSYNIDGNLIGRFASQGALNAPWGLALAPEHFGPFGGALLVGNNGDGYINAFDQKSGAMLGKLVDDNGIPIAIPNLWTLTFGNGHMGGDSDTLFFTAGVNYDEHGLFGAIQAPERRGADTGGSGVFDPNAPGEVGDYPLPPSGGPVFRTDITDRPLPVSDLLPLRESSLVLFPTLSSIVQQGMRRQASGAASPITGVAVSGSVLTAVPAFYPISLAPADGNSPRASAGTKNAIALNRFLDWHATAQSSKQPGPGLLPPSEQADEVLPVVSPERRAEPANERAMSDASVDTRNGSGWANLMNLLFVASLSITWTYWLRHSPRVQWRPVIQGLPCHQSDMHTVSPV